MLISTCFFCLVITWIAGAPDPSINGNEHQPRKLACRQLDGRCIKKRKPCPLDLPETKKGPRYCRGKKRCCYPGDPSPGSCPLAGNKTRAGPSDNDCTFPDFPKVPIPEVSPWYRKHVRNVGNSADMTGLAAYAITVYNRRTDDPVKIKTSSVFFGLCRDRIRYRSITVDDERRCEIINHVRTFRCNRNGWYWKTPCVDCGLCTAQGRRRDGHLEVSTIRCQTPTLCRYPSPSNQAGDCFDDNGLQNNRQIIRSPWFKRHVYLVSSDEFITGTAAYQKTAGNRMNDDVKINDVFFSNSNGDTIEYDPIKPIEVGGEWRCRIRNPVHTFKCIRVNNAANGNWEDPCKYMGKCITEGRRSDGHIYYDKMQCTPGPPPNP